MMVQKGESLVIGPNVEVVTQQIWKVIFAGIDYCESFFLRFRVASYPGGQFSTKEGQGVLNQVVVLLSQYC